MSTIQKVELDTTQRCPDAIEFEARLRDRVVGQDEATEKLSWPACCSFWARLGFRTQNLGTTWFPPPLVPSALSPFYCQRKR
jgi:hypothetical protein